MLVAMRTEMDLKNENDRFEDLLMLDPFDADHTFKVSKHEAEMYDFNRDVYPEEIMEKSKSAYHKE